MYAPPRSHVVCADDRSVGLPLLQSSSPSMILRHKLSMRCARLITFVDWIYYARLVGLPFVDPTLLPSIKNIMSNISRVRYATPCSDKKTATMNMTDECIVISTIVRDLLCDVMDVGKLF